MQLGYVLVQRLLNSLDSKFLPAKQTKVQAVYAGGPTFSLWASTKDVDSGLNHMQRLSSKAQNMP